MSAPPSSFARSGLAACCVGLALCPLAYIATGALSGFAPVFAMITLPPLAAALGFLLYRLLGRPQPAGSLAGAAAEAGAWLVIVAFLVLVSGFTLMTPFERLGQTLSLFLICTVVSVPVIVWRRATEIGRRTAALSDAMASLLLFGLLAVCGAVALLYLMQPPAFP